MTSTTALQNLYHEINLTPGQLRLVTGAAAHGEIHVHEAQIHDAEHLVDAGLVAVHFDYRDGTGIAAPRVARYQTCNALSIAATAKGRGLCARIRAALRRANT